MKPISEALAQQGPHERNIRTLFPGAFVREGTEPLFTKPLYLLAFTNRSGSNLLADYLRQTREFRGFGEGLNWDTVQRSLEQYPADSFPDYVARLAGPLNEPGRWGIKASWEQIVMLKRANIFSMFPSVQVIHSVREDLVGQAVSHWIAHQTNQWTSAQQGSGVNPDYAGDRIEHILMDAVRSNGFINLICRTLDLPRHVVVYERLQANPADEISRLGHALSLDLDGWQPGTPRIARQRNATNATFRSECMQDWMEAIRDDTVLRARRPDGAPGRCD